MDIFSIESNRLWLDGGAMFGNVPKQLWSKWIRCDNENRIPVSCRCLLVKDNGRHILFETGVGFHMSPKHTLRYGVEGAGNRLLSNLEAKNIKEDDIDYVILSHLHFDHAGGLVPSWPGTEKKDWSPLFPNAKYIAGKKQFERAKSPHPRDRASYIPGLCEKLEETKRLSLVDNPGKAAISNLGDIISFHFSNGHTPGLMHSIIHANGKTIFFASDMIPGTSWLHLPVTMGYDRNPELLIDEKKKLLEKAAAGNWIIFYTHDPEVSASRLTYDKDKKKYIRTDYSQILQEDLSCRTLREGDFFPPPAK